MKCIILCGGQGSRIRDISELMPKPMLPIGKMPILWHIMKSYAAHGIEDFVLCLGYKGWNIREFFLNYNQMVSDCTVKLGQHSEVTHHGKSVEENWSVTLVDTGEKTMTGGRIWRARKYVESDDLFCLTYGDGLGNIDIDKLISQHRASGLIATITGVRVQERFGELAVADNKVAVFNEKPVATSGRINGGFMVFDAKRIWNYLTDSQDLVLEREPLERLASDGELGIYEHDGYWQCMDTPRELAMLNDLWTSGKAPWKTW